MLNSCSPLHFSVFHSLPDVLALCFHVATHVLFCKSKGHFLVFLSLFFPKTDLLKRVDERGRASDPKSAHPCFSCKGRYIAIFRTFRNIAFSAVSCVSVCYTRRTSDERSVGRPSGRAGDGVEGTNKRAAAAPGEASARGRDTTGEPSMTNFLKIQ